MAEALNWGPRAPRVAKPFGGALPFGAPRTAGAAAGGGYPEASSGQQVSSYAARLANATRPKGGASTVERYDVGGAITLLDYHVAHGSTSNGSGANSGVNPKRPLFILVRDAGTGEADGVYKPADRMWEGVDVYANRFGDCIISREAHKSPKTGQVRYGFVIGQDGNPLYGVKTEELEVPDKGWKAFQGSEPVPEVKVFKTWSACCQHGAYYFAEEAFNAAKGSHWKVVLLFADRAFDCHTCARPKGQGDLRGGGLEWARMLCELLGTRADAFLHLGEYKKALVDACAAVHFVPAFDWSKAQTRGVAACLNLGIEEDQAKLLMAACSRRSGRDFPGIHHLEPWVDGMMEKARRRELEALQVQDEKPPDDGRIYFKVVDPEDCVLYAHPRYGAKLIGRRSFDDVVRGEEVLKNGTWLLLHVSEDFETHHGAQRAYVPIFTEDTVEAAEEDREEILERIQPGDYPRPTTWERLGLVVKPLGLKPPTDAEVPFPYSRWKDPPRDKAAKAWPYVYKHGLAISTMLCGVPSSVIESFIRYHWGIGFNHVFLYFDDPDDPGIALTREMQELIKTHKVEGIGLSVQPLDAAWWETVQAASRFFQRRERSDMYDTVCKMHEKYKDVESRELIVMDMAVTEAHRMGIDWYVHLDIDECFYVPQKLENSARRYLGALQRSVEAVRLFNLEAVPEKEECADWFRECTLFQVNKALCRGFQPQREYDDILRQREGKEFVPEPADPEKAWLDKLMAKVHVKRQPMAKELRIRLPGQARSPPLDGVVLPPGMETTKMGETFPGFTAYECGKTAVRLDRHFRPPLPLSPHTWLQDSGDLIKEYHQSTDAVVLHYPNASFTYWKQKYERLGGVPSTRRGQPNPMRFHMASSEVVLHRERDEQEQFFRTFVMQNEYSELASLAEYGVLVRVEGVRNCLAYVDKEHKLEDEELPGRIKVFASNGIQFGR